MPDDSVFRQHLCRCSDCLEYMRRLEDESEEEEGLSALHFAAERLAEAIRSHPWLWDRADGNGGLVAEAVRDALERKNFKAHVALIPPRREVVRLAERDGWDCAYCGCALEGKPDRPIPHVDHVIPKSQGGSNSLSNKVLACPTCNLSKGARTPEEWRAAKK